MFGIALLMGVDQVYSIYYHNEILLLILYPLGKEAEQSKIVGSTPLTGANKNNPPEMLNIY